MFQVLPLCPFLLMNKIYSASKLIGEILMPALLMKDEKLQKELIKTLQVISCMSLGTTSVIISTPEDELGYTIFSNNAIAVSAVCSRCHADKIELNCDVFLPKMRKEVEIYSKSNILTPSQHSTMMGLRSLFTKFLNSKHYVDLETSGLWNLANTLCHHFFVFDHIQDLLTIANSGHVLKALKPFLCEDLVSILVVFQFRIWFIDFRPYTSFHGESSLKVDRIAHPVDVLEAEFPCTPGMRSSIHLSIFNHHIRLLSVLTMANPFIAV